MLTLTAALMLFAAPPADDAFKSWFDEKSVAVSKAKEDGKTFPWIRGTAELDATPADVTAILADFPTYKKTFDPVLLSVKVLGTEGSTTRLHLQWPYPWPLSDRDAIVAYTLEKDADGTVRLTWKADAKKGDPKTIGVRIAAVEGSTIVAPLEGGRSRVTYTYYGDVGGDFGEKASEKAWRGQPVHYVESLRDALKKKAK